MGVTNEAIPLGLNGQGDLRALASLLGDYWFDCDRAMVTQFGEIRAWPGCMRRGRKLFDSSVHGDSGVKIQVMGADQGYIRKNRGHLLACVDRNANTEGRVLAIGHQPSGLLGTQLVGRPVQTTGSGLSDVETRGAFSGNSPSVFTVEIDGTGTPDTFKWSNDGGDTFEATTVSITGDWQTLENGVEIKFNATTGHTSGDEWAFAVGGRPMLLAEMNRQEAHIYPALAGGPGRTLISHSRNHVLVDNGRRIDAAGLLDPHIQPQVAVASNVVDGNENIIGDTDDSPTNWVAANEKVLVQANTTLTFPSGASAGVQIDPDDSGVEGDLAYVNVSGTIESTVKRITLWAYRLFSDLPIKPKHRTLVIATGTGLTGTRYELKIDQHIYRRWQKIDLPWDQESNVSYQSIGLKGRSASATLVLDGIEKIDDSDTPDSELFGEQEWQFMFTWYRRVDNRESGPSPVSDVIHPKGKAVELDLSGFYPDIDDGLQNAPPDDVDAVHIYGFRPSFATDPRLGGGSFFRITPDDGFDLARLKREFSVDVSADGGNTGNGTVEDIRVLADLADQTITLEAQGTGPGATFTVVSSVLGSLSDATSGGSYASEDEVIRFTITDGGTAWQSGDTLTLTITSDARTDGKIIARLTDEVELSELTVNPRHPFYNRRLDPADCMAVDGDLIVLGGQAAYGVGQWTWTDESHVITPVVGAGVADTPVVDRWMEGRTIRREGEAENYRIIKALDTNDDGVLDALWVAKAFDPAENEFVGAFSGTTGAVNSVIEGNTEEIWWTNKTSERGVDVETSSPLNRLKVMPAGDRIIGINKVGEFLWVLGEFNSFILKQDTAALADLPNDSGAAYANPLHLNGIGLLGRRCWMRLPQGGALFISSRGELMVASPNGAERHPISDQLSALLSGWGYLTSTRSLRHSFADYIATGTDEFVYIGLIKGGQADVYGQPGVRRLATDHYRGRTDGGGESVFEETYLSGWEDYDDDGNIDYETIIEALNPDGFPIWFKNIEYESLQVSNETSDPPAAESWVSPDPSDPTDSVTFGDGVNYTHLDCPKSLFDGATEDFIATASPGTAYVEDSDYIHPDCGYIVLRMKSNQDIPVGALSIGFGPENWFDELGVKAVQADAITASEGWQYVRFTWPGNGGVAKAFETVRIYSTGIWDASSVTGDVEIDFSNGRQVADAGFSETDSPVDPLDFGEPCIAPGSSIGTGALGEDFELGILIDLRQQKLYLGSECRFSCPGISPASACTSEVMQTGPNFFGNRDGYIDQVFDDKLLSWGSPSGRFQLTVASGTTTTVTIDRTFDGASNQLSLSLDADGNGLLDQLIVALIPQDDSTQTQFRRISSNTVDTITVSSAWTTNPSAGDLLLVAPLPWLVHWSERIFGIGGTFRTFAGQYSRGHVQALFPSDDTYEPRLRFEVFASDDRKREIEELTPDVTKWTDGDEFPRGRGTVQLSAKTARALSLRLMAIQGQAGPAKIANPVMHERSI